MRSITSALFFLAAAGASSYASTVNFSTFVSGPAINAVETQNATIGFTYAGDKFVGSVYIGPNNLQLYSTDLTGGNVQKFGTPLPAGGGEVIVAGALGSGGYGNGSIYAGTGTDIYKYAPSGGAPTLFATGLAGGVRGMLFDPGSSFGGSLIVSTASGNIYEVSNTGVATLLTSTGQDTEGLDIIPTNAVGMGSFAGDLITASEGSGLMRLITPTGAITIASINGGGGLALLETVNFIPLSFSGDPVEGYYAANYPVDIQKAGASQFAGLGGHILATSEYGSNAPVWDIQYSGSGNAFTATLAGNLPNQAEDGIFVTTQRVHAATPEPGSFVLLGCGLAALAGVRRMRARSAQPAAAR